MLTYRRGEYSSASAIAEDAIALARRLGATTVTAEAITTLGHVAFVRGQNPEAVARYEEAVALRRIAGDDEGLLSALSNFGLALTVSGDLERAEAVLTEARDSSRARQRPFWEAIALLRLGSLAHRRDDLVSAAAHFEVALTLLGDGNALVVAWLRGDAAAVARDQGNLPQAAEYLHASLARRWVRLERRGISECLAGLAELAVLTGRHEPALRLFGAAEALRREIGILDAWHEQPRRLAAQVAARRAIGEIAGATAFVAGQELPLAEAVELAMSVADGIRTDPAVQATLRPAHGLTDRELEVLRLVATGRSDREIGEVLHISHRTVSRHLQSIYTKLDVNSRTAASAFAHRFDLA
jgi:DNA-binding CsgD family transcriptional regulator